MAPNVFDIVQRDVCRNLSVSSLGGSLHSMSSIADHSRYCGVYAPKVRADVLSKLCKQHCMLERHITHEL